MIQETLRYLDPHYEELEVEMGNLNISGLPFIDRSTPLFIILSVYLVFALWFGPKHMVSRSAYNVHKFIVIYNISQILWNSWALYKDVYASVMLLTSRIWDLMDTVFLILRKKLHQVTFLHVYHHTSVCFVIWFFMKYLLVEQGLIFVYINSIVHTVMYSYYLLAALGPKYAKYLWWKKYLTILQLTQFFFMTYYLISTIVMDSNLIKLASYILLAYAGSFIILFLNFFVNTYTKKSK